MKKNSFNINNISYIIDIMNEADFIQAIMQQANLTEDQGDIVNQIFQENFIAGNKNKETIVNLLAEKLGIDKAQADQIYTIAAGLLASGILDKIKGFFKR